MQASLMPESEQVVVIAGLMHRLAGRQPVNGHPCGSLVATHDRWAD